MVLIRSFEELIVQLGREGIPYRAHLDNIAVEVQTDGGAVWVRWDRDHHLLQGMQVLAERVAPEDFVEMAARLHELNHRLVLPGWGMNTADGSVYFRVVIPRDPAGITVSYFMRLVHAVAGSVRRYLTGRSGPHAALALTG